MPPRFHVEPGLPAYGPRAISFPEAWGRTGQEGLVVRFEPDDASTWVGNFQTGHGAQHGVRVHPDRRSVLVVAAGNLWTVDPHAQRAEQMDGWFDELWDIPGTGEVILSRQGLAFARLGEAGLVWHARRLSWDGFDAVCVRDDLIEGRAWSPFQDEWLPFKVDLRTGEAAGGSFLELDSSDWESLAL